MNERGRSHCEVLHRPHLMLADARGPDDVTVLRQGLQRLDHALWLERVFAVAVPERELLTPGGELAQPWRGAGDDARSLECAQLVREVGKHLLQGADHGKIRLAELSDLC